MVRGSDALPRDLRDEILSALESDPGRPWCVHRLYDELSSTAAGGNRDRQLEVLRAAADDLARQGKIRMEAISALSIGVHCQDWLYWSARTPKSRLDEFGPEYESPTILHRLASHMTCHGL